MCRTHARIRQTPSCGVLPPNAAHARVTAHGLSRVEPPPARRVRLHRRLRAGDSGPAMCRHFSLIMSTDQTGHIATRQERFLALLLPVRERLSQFARALTRDRDEADDLVSDTILIAYEQFDGVRHPDAFLGYLFTIATRRHRRQRWRGRLFGRYDEERAHAIAGSGTTPEVAADVQALRAALARLPMKQREAVMLFEIAGLTLQEICAVQGGSLSGVKSRIVRGRARLAELLGASGGPASGGGIHVGTVPHSNGIIIYSDISRDEPAQATASRIL